MLEYLPPFIPTNIKILVLIVCSPYRSCAYLHGLIQTLENYKTVFFFMKDYTSNYGHDPHFLKSNALLLLKKKIRPLISVLQCTPAAIAINFTR